MFKWLKRFKETPPPAQGKTLTGFFSTDLSGIIPGRGMIDGMAKSIQIDPMSIRPVTEAGVAMDSIQGGGAKFTSGVGSLYQQQVPDSLAYWYGSQGFIGYQMCAIIAQNWLVDKACTMPARDAVRNGYEISLPEGNDVDDKKIAALKAIDKKMNIKDEMTELMRFARIFGVRVVMFNIESKDPLYYEKPFNPDGITKGSYRGISQVDPYWITPELDFQAASNPSSPDFYEPTWWRVSGRRIHRSHLIIVRPNEVADVLKPSYFYGGVSVPQKIFDRVYAAERTANEAPMLALSKRTTTIHVDLTQVEANKEAFMEKMNLWTYFRNNYGIKILGNEEVMEQFDTSLTDLDAAIMTQYQIVAAAANVPATKLLGTTPKGFNSSGDYEESNYHEELEAIQSSDLTPFLNRHHLLCIRSEISPDAPFETDISWNPVDAPSAPELADLNLKKAQTGAALASSGAIDGVDERNRLILDKDSGYANLPTIEDPIEPTEGDESDVDE